MNKVRIEELRDQYRNRAMKAEQNYQDSGVSRYAAQMNRAEDIAEALQIAADAADEHNTLLDLRTCLAELGSQAQQLNRNIERDTCNWIDVKVFIKTVISEARIRGLIK